MAKTTKPATPKTFDDGMDAIIRASTQANFQDAFNSQGVFSNPEPAVKSDDTPKPENKKKGE
jgi:hypothetical protein